MTELRWAVERDDDHGELRLIVGDLNTLKGHLGDETLLVARLRYPALDGGAWLSTCILTEKKK